MDLTLVLQARGFRGCFEAGAVDFLLFALDCAYRAGVRVNLSRLLCAHTGCVTGVLATSALTAAHAPLPALFCERTRLPGPNALFHAWVDLPLPHNWHTRALHEAISGAFAHVPHVVLACAGPPVRRLPRFARALVVAISRGALSDAPAELTAGIEGAAHRGRAAAGASSGGAGSSGGLGRSRLSYGRPKPRNATFLVLDDARDHRGQRDAPSLSVYTSSLRVEQSWTRFRNIAVAAATAPEILAAVLAACQPGFGDILSPQTLFRSIAQDGEHWREKLLRTTPRLEPYDSAGKTRKPPRIGMPEATWSAQTWSAASAMSSSAGDGQFTSAITSEMTSAFGSESEEDSFEEEEEEVPEDWSTVTLTIDTCDVPEKEEQEKEERAPRVRRARERNEAYSSLSASSDSDVFDGATEASPVNLTFVLRPSSNLGPAPRCLATSVLGPMGAALVKSVRLHDYLLGRHNMQRFLLEELVHPATGESLLPLCGVAAVPVPVPEWPSFDATQEKSIQKQSRRIWDAFITDWHSAMRSSSLSHTQVLTSVKFAHRPQSVRIKRSLDRLSRGVIARLFFSLTSGIRSAKAKRAREAEHGTAGQYLEDGN